LLRNFGDLLDLLRLLDLTADSPAARIAATLDIGDEDLRNALARLGAAIKRT